MEKQNQNLKQVTQNLLKIRKLFSTLPKEVAVAELKRIECMLGTKPTNIIEYEGKIYKCYDLASVENLLRHLGIVEPNKKIDRAYLSKALQGKRKCAYGVKMYRIKEN